MPGPLPKPAAERHRREAPTYETRRLPASGRPGPAPELPPLRAWSTATLEAWSYWWSTPQACAWDQSGRSLHRWAMLYDEIATDGGNASLHGQLMALEDRHGMSPVAMAKLRWEIVTDAEPTPTSASGKTAKARRMAAVK
jgi:hypothetical protein